MVLRRRDAGEADRRLTLLTEELGVIDAIAKGARKGGSRLAGSSEPLTVAILQLAPGKRQLYVTQTQPVTSFPGLRTDYERLTFALALCEVAAEVLPHEQPAPEAFAFLVAALKYLEVHPKPLVALVWAEVRFLELAGFAPSFSECVVSGNRISEAEPWLSPTAGGYVGRADAERFPDRFFTKAEVLYGLAALQELDEPPVNLKHAADALRVLVRFWRHFAERPLPGHEAALSLV